MSQEKLREQNKRLVVEKALHLFTENGIENTKVKDVAKAAGLTERSVYRYFETKTDLVLATAYLYWDTTTEKIQKSMVNSEIYTMPGIDRIRTLLYYYSSMFFESPKGVRFILNAEMALYNAGLNKIIINRPPIQFDVSDSPLVMAIRIGLEDGSVSKNVDVKELYYTAYDSILGIMQRLALETTSLTDIDNKKRMKNLCDMLVREFSA